MLPGEPIYIKCPHCEGLLALPTLLSGNTFSYRRWSDGNACYPMLPQLEVVALCEHCRKPFWTEKAPRVELDPEGWIEVRDDSPLAQLFGNETRLEYPGLAYLGWGPGADGWLRGIEQGMSMPGQEVQFRLKAWWELNDAARNGEPETPWHEQTNNLEILLDLLTDDEWLLAAEVLRALGRFSDSLRHLDQGGDASSLTALTTSDAPLLRARVVKQERSLFCLEDHGGME